MAIPDAHIVSRKAEGLQSLAWDGDELVDWADGGTRYGLAGQITARNLIYAYGFDAAVAEGRDAVIFARRQTKGLVLRDGQILREIDRSFYCAYAFDYPIAVFRLASGRRVIAHCARGTGRLDIEDFETGEILTAKAARTPGDNFHARLSASPDGRFLLSAGWAWQPYDDLRVFDLDRALADASHLDGPGLLPAVWSEAGALAAFHRDNRLVVGINVDGEDTSNEERTSLYVFDLATQKPIIKAHPEGPIGRLVGVGANYVLNLCGHPQLLDLATGQVVRSWPEIVCDRQMSATGRNEPFAHVAIDIEHSRLAIGLDGRITVMTFAN